MKPIIKTRWETDAYKLSMGMIFWLLFKGIIARYVFVDRNKMPYIPGLIERLREQIHMVADLPAHIDRAHYVKRRWPWMNWLFLDWYANHKFDPKQVKISLVNNQVSIVIEGPIEEITYWEIFILRIYSTLYSEMAGRKPKSGYGDEAEFRAKFFFDHGILWVEGGGRRAFNPEVHWEALTRSLKYSNKEGDEGGLLGTSWIEYAFQLNLMQFGTQAHEFTAFLGGYFGHEHANEKALEIWVKTYGKRLGYALPDSYGPEDFFMAFKFGYADIFSGLRHDSGPAIPFVERALAHYRSPLIDIDTTTKYVVHSNSIKSFEESLNLKLYKPNEYLRSLLIGGWHTNNVGYDPYNTVIKMWWIKRNNEIRHTVKIPFDPRKAVGDPGEVKKVIQQMNIVF